MSQLQPPKPSEEAIALWRKRKAGVIGKVSDQQISSLAKDFQKLISQNQLQGTIVRPAENGKVCLVRLARQWKGLRQVSAIAIEGCTKHQKVTLLRGEDKKWYAIGKPNETGVRSREQSRSKKVAPTPARSPIAYCYLCRIMRRESPTAAWREFTQVWIGGFQEENVLIRELPGSVPFPWIRAVVDIRGDSCYVGIFWTEGSGFVSNIEYWQYEIGSEPEKVYEIVDVMRFVKDRVPEGLIALPNNYLVLGNYLGFGCWVTAEPFGWPSLDNRRVGTVSVAWNPDSKSLEFKFYIAYFEPGIKTSITPGVRSVEPVENKGIDGVGPAQKTVVVAPARIDQSGKLLFQGTQIYEQIPFGSSGEYDYILELLLGIRGYREFMALRRSNSLRFDVTFNPQFEAYFLDGNTPFQVRDFRHKKRNSDELQPTYYYYWYRMDAPTVPVYRFIDSETGQQFSYSEAETIYRNFFADLYSDRVTFIDLPSLLNRGVPNRTRSSDTSTTVQIQGVQKELSGQLFDIYPELEALRGNPLPDPDSDSYQNLEHVQRSCTVHVYSLDLDKIEELLVDKVFPIQYGMIREDAGELLQPIDYYFCNASYSAEG